MPFSPPGRTHVVCPKIRHPEAGVLNRLDPRAPLVIDTRELGRRPGSMRRVRREVPAPDFLGDAVLGVRPTRPIELELRLESVMEGVLVSGSARTYADGECGRCLEPLRHDLNVELQELFFYPDLDREAADDEVVELDGGGLLDLEPTLRDAVVLSLPRQPLCREDCPGLCSQCGAQLADEPDHRHEIIDSRWATLAGLAGVVAPDTRTSSLTTSQED